MTNTWNDPTLTFIEPPHITQCHMRTHCDHFGKFDACNEVTVICDQYEGQCKEARELRKVDSVSVSCAECGWHVKQLKFWDDHQHFPYITWWCSHPLILRDFNVSAPMDGGYSPTRTKPDKIYYNLLKEIPVACTVNCPWCPLRGNGGDISCD